VGPMYIMVKVRPRTTLVAALFGLGILVLIVSLLTDAYSWQMGVIGLVVLWGLAFVLRVFLVTPEE